MGNMQIDALEQNAKCSSRPWATFASGAIGLLVFLILFSASRVLGDQVPVRYAQGAVHGFLVLQTLDGDTLADGDLTQVAKGDRVTGHLVFHFKDGSLYDETSVFTQRGSFHLVSDHLIMKGPTFKQPMETSLSTLTGIATVRYADSDGNEKAVNEKEKFPADLANGMIPILATNLQPSAAETKVSMLASTPKPRIVTLAFTPAGDETFSAGGATHKSVHYVMKIQIGGLAGAVAPIVGKQPPDTNVWVSAGDPPVFLKMEGPLYDGGASLEDCACESGLAEGRHHRRALSGSVLRHAAVFYFSSTIVAQLPDHLSCEG